MDANFFKKGSTVAITLTTKDTIVSQTKPKAQHACAYPIILKLFRHIGDLVLYPEFTKKGQIHYHGTLLIRDHIKLYNSVAKINRDLGFVYMSKITDFCKEDHVEPSEKWLVLKKVIQKKYPTWDSYIRKDSELVEELLDLKLPLNSRADINEGIRILKEQKRKKNERFDALENGIMKELLLVPSTEGISFSSDDSSDESE